MLAVLYSILFWPFICVPFNRLGILYNNKNCMSYIRQTLAADLNKFLLSIKNNIKIPVARIEGGPERPKPVVQKNRANLQVFSKATVSRKDL
jgi:hypothetical protein